MEHGAEFIHRFYHAGCHVPESIGRSVMRQKPGQRRWSKRAALLAAGLWLISGGGNLLAHAEEAGDDWLTDARTGCKIMLPFTVPDRVASWNGACQEGLAHDKGTVSWTIQNRPEGRMTANFFAGRADGAGEMIWNSGRRYTGAFKAGHAHGEGTYIWLDGTRYEGAWERDVRHGKGTLTLPNGDRYIGRFEQNRPTGAGDYITLDGSRYRPLVAADGRVGPGASLDPPPPKRIPSAEAPLPLNSLDFPMLGAVPAADLATPAPPKTQLPGKKPYPAE